MYDHAPLQILRDRAALFTGAIEGEGQAWRRVQPLQLPGNAKPRFVEMADLHFGHALADARIDPAAGLLPCFEPRPRCWPGRSAARRKDRSELARSDPRE